MTSFTSEFCRNSQLSKVERYGWEMKDEPGELMHVDKKRLRIDHEYQRSANEVKVTEITKRFSWLALGAIVVVRRGDAYYVVDGQHRVMAAMRRTDIATLPCVVFSSASTRDEAQGFLDANTLRKPISAFDKFRALVMTGDPAALHVSDLVEREGRKLSKNLGATTLSCVGLMLRQARQNPAALDSVWAVVTAICAGKPIYERLLDGLFYIETHIADGEHITDAAWLKRIIKAGPEALNDGANRAAAFYSRGGAKVWASGMIEVLNKGHRNRLEMLGTK